MTAIQQHASSFPTMPAGQLRVGDLIHHPGNGAATYVLVARATVVDDVVHLMVYDTAHPDGTPATCRPDERVLVACRDLLEPDGGLRAWTDASWRRAHRRGAAFALMDQIQARSVGLPPVAGADAEIHRLRGRDPIPPRVVPVAELPDLLAGQHRDAHLVLDVDQPGIRAILTLFMQLKRVESDDGTWNGADVVAIVSEWFDRLGIDPNQTVDQLDGRVVAAVSAHGEDLHLACEAVREADDAAPDVPELADGYAVVDLDRVAELVRAEGVECVIDTPGSGVAVLLAGAPTEEPAWAFPWAVQAGPGRFAWERPSLASTGDLRVGPDTADRDAAVLVRELGAVTAEQIADLVITQTRRRRLRSAATADLAGRDAVRDDPAQHPPATDASGCPGGAVG